MKQTRLLRTLLAAVCLLVGTNAWGADPIYSWVGGTSEATEIGGSAAGTFSAHTTVAGDLYAMTIAGKSTDLSTGGVTITLNSALQEGDIIRVTGFQDKNASDKVTALFMSFNEDDTNKGNISDTENWVNLNTTENCATGTEPDLKTYTVTASLAGSNKITLIRTNGYTGTNLFINKIQIVRPVVNAKFTFEGATINNKSITGETGTMSWTDQWTPNPGIDNNMFRVGNMSDGVVNLVGEAAGAKDLVTITFDMGVVQLTGKYAEFKVTDVNSTVLVDESFCVYDNKGFEENKNTFGFAIGNIVSKGGTNNPGMTNDTKNTFTMTFDYATKKMTCKIVNKNDTYTKTVDMPDGAGAIKSFAVRSNYNNSDRRCYFDNLTITTTPGDYTVVDADYTVKFVDEEGTEIRESVTRSGSPGSTIEATTGDKGSFWGTTKKYYYKSDDAEGKTIAANGSTVLTITYREAGTFNYTVNSSLGTLIYSSSTTEGESVTVPFPTYELSEGKLYKANAIDDNSKKFSKTFTVSNNGQTETITYTENKTNVVFYSEGERVSDITSTTTSNANVRGSMCAAGYNGTENNVIVTTLSSFGTYKITIATYGSKGSYTFAFKAGDRSIVTAEYPGTNGPTYSGEFIITGNTDIIWPPTDENHAIDYIFIEKISDEANITATTTSAGKGWATLYSDYALDFTNATPATLKAYTATLEGTTVTLKEVQNVPAGTGVVLKSSTTGENVNYSIPVIASSTNDEKGSMTGSTSDTHLDEGDAYLLGINGENKAQFFINSEGTIAAGKAYLPAGNAGAKALSVVFANDLTGITNANAAEEIAQPAKRIVNGQLVIEKNGKRYNAAGAEL